MGTRLRATPSTDRAAQAALRRRAAAEWIASLTGAEVPWHSDRAFRAALRDGVTLCRLLNALRPGSVPKASAVCGWVGAHTHAHGGVEQ